MTTITISIPTDIADSLLLGTNTRNQKDNQLSLDDLLVKLKIFSDQEDRLIRKNRIILEKKRSKSLQSGMSDFSI